MGWGGFLDKLLDKLPIQGRVERWKNEKENCEKELVQLKLLNLDVNNAEDRKKGNRIGWLRNRIDYLQQLLLNKNS